MTPEDLQKIRAFLKKEGISVLNTRAFKLGNDEFEITIGSVDSEKSRKVEFEGAQISIRYGEFSLYLSQVIYYLKKASEYVANDIQKEMLDLYIEHF